MSKHLASVDTQAPLVCPCWISMAMKWGHDFGACPGRHARPSSGLEAFAADGGHSTFTALPTNASRANRWVRWCRGGWHKCVHRATMSPLPSPMCDQEVD